MAAPIGQVVSNLYDETIDRFFASGRSATADRKAPSGAEGHPPWAKPGGWMLQRDFRSLSDNSALI